MNIDIALHYAIGLVFGAEGFSPAAFADNLCRPPRWTIGHGTTRVNGQPVTAGMTCTRAQADEWAMDDLRAVAAYVLREIHVPLNTWQLAALTSFAYNIGDGHFFESSVRDALNKGLYQIAADRLLEYDEADGVPLHGLDTRRARERALFLCQPFPVISTGPSS